MVSLRGGLHGFLALEVEEVLELLYDCQGMITRLELFNLKDYTAGKTAHLAGISRLMQAINEGSPIHLKQIIREIIHRLKQDASSDTAVPIDRISEFVARVGELAARIAPAAVCYGFGHVGDGNIHMMILPASDDGVADFFYDSDLSESRYGSNCKI